MSRHGHDGRQLQPGSVLDVAVDDNQNQQLQVAAVHSDGRAGHGVRRPSGIWYQFGDVTANAGTYVGTANRVTIAGE